jgi:DNA polymerase-3 subunit epsilon
MMRQIILDTETTGLDPVKGHRIIEIGCLELVNRRLTGKVFHYYLNPERDIDTGAVAVHGITKEFLANKPKFNEILPNFLEFVTDAELVIHNAPFDLGFINAELKKSKHKKSIETYCTVLDTLVLARKNYPGQRNSLDALCKRLKVDNSNRKYHGALLDAELLAEVYLQMTGGQVAMNLSEQINKANSNSEIKDNRYPKLDLDVITILPNDHELSIHNNFMSED